MPNARPEVQDENDRHEEDEIVRPDGGAVILLFIIVVVTLINSGDHSLLCVFGPHLRR
jgi:hypothetical protein